MTGAGDGAPSVPDIRPVVAMRPNNRSVWVFGIGLALAIALLFYALESRRQTAAAPAIVASGEDVESMISAPPDLSIPLLNPPEGSEVVPQIIRPSDVSRSRSGAATSPPPQPAVPNFQAPVGSLPLGSPLVGGDYLPPAAQTPPVTSGPQVVYDAATSQGSSSTEQEAVPGKKGEERVRARRFTNPSTTVPKGTIIQAVLETALDSTRPGFARAIISRDVFSFDGSKILIPKGSRLIGEYDADLASGQKRALIQWQRLMRPDGVVINIDSPAADPLGRAGVSGKVNTHFLERFSGAILQSALDVGVQIAARRATRDTVILALPGSTQGIVGASPEKIQPTLKVKQGASVSVFVARDLDFTSVGS